MAEQTARQIYENFCAYMDSRKWRYDRDNEAMRIRCEVRGEDLPFAFVVNINERLKILSVYTFLLGCDIPQNKIIEMALAVNAVNSITADGSFDLSLEDGSLIYRVTTSYRETQITFGMMDHMIKISGFFADQFNDKFLDLVEGRMSIDEFIEFTKK